MVDLQKKILGFSDGASSGEIMERSANIAKTFRERGLPVLVHVNGRARGRTQSWMPHFELPPNFAEIVPEMGPEAGDHLLTKQRFWVHGTDLDAYLRKQGVTQVFFAGIATGAGVESTGHGAYDPGYHVAFVTDAMTDRCVEAHQHSVEKVFPRIRETTTSDEVLALVKN